MVTGVGIVAAGDVDFLVVILPLNMLVGTRGAVRSVALKRFRVNKVRSQAVMLECCTFQKQNVCIAATLQHSNGKITGLQPPAT